MAEHLSVTSSKHSSKARNTTFGQVTTSVFWRLMMRVCLVGGLTHGVFGLLFYELGASILAWVNVGSVLMFAFSFFLLRKKHNNLAVLLVFIELFGHAGLAVRMIGWESGFNYYLLLVAPIIVTSNFRNTHSKLLLVVAVCFFYLMLDGVIRDLTPVYSLSSTAINGLRYFNIVVTFVLLTYLSFIYMGMIKKAESQLQWAASTDALTGLLNRRRLGEIIEYEMTRSKREPRTLCFLLGDIDYFKRINDSYGHDAGDRVLVATSQALRSVVREQDSISRWGGEEFLIVLPNTTLESATLVGERIVALFQPLQVPVGEQNVPVTMTFGLSSCHQGESVEQAIARADAALYQGKSAGRNRLVRESRDSEAAVKEPL